MARAGFRVSGFVENWVPAIQSHLANFRDCAPIGAEAGGDIARIPDAAFEALRGEVDLLFAGFPCQGFSHAGKKDPNDARNRLFWEFVRAAELIQPRWIVGENVFGLLAAVALAVAALVWRRRRGRARSVPAGRPSGEPSEGGGAVATGGGEDVPVRQPSAEGGEAERRDAGDDGTSPIGRPPTGEAK